MATSASCSRTRACRHSTAYHQLLMNQIGITTWVWAAPLSNEELPGIARHVAELGFDLLEVPIEHTADLDYARAAEALRANGLAAKPKDNEPFDTVEVAGKRVAFDGDWKKQQLSEQDYMKAFADADARYSQMLAALIAQVKKPS